ncbi:MAG: bifunctional adenosylcobinamide kinase/adenosylcobinamide-phosphate guanylyltransferase [Spirochaetes bacterium]|nr:bifunctional adenosylcobinamide kinase/adenosylcobinamide-phosphate guanylyltransferase [Spirochaetota bacterium]
MSMIRFITGGARSGKSRFAEDFLKNEDNVIYIATGIAFDDEMKDRIAKHQESRNSKWITLEAYKGFKEILKDKLADREFMLLDCVTIMVTNLMILEKNIDWDKIDPDEVNKIEKTIQDEVLGFMDAAKNFSGQTIIVSNELGMGIVPPTPVGRHYRDIAGRMNQIIAGIADEVYFVVSGIPVKIKG